MFYRLIARKSIPFTRQITSSAREQLSALLGSRFTESEAIRQAHAVDESYHSWSEGIRLPDGVCFPQSTEEVSGIAKLCHSHNIPMIAYGTGTSLEGHITALKKGLVIDFSQMKSIVETNLEDMDCLVQGERTESNASSPHAVLLSTCLSGCDPGAAE